MPEVVIDHRYDQMMHHELIREYYDQSGFYNFGYWCDDTQSPREASENLLEKLLAFIPAKQGRILDVACGLGGTTRHLLRYFPAEAVVGINISDAQLTTSRQNVPECDFVRMDAARLAFRGASFENLICVEAAFHFSSRADFLREAYRVLAPGGSLVLTDILMPRWAAQINPRIPRANWVPDLDAYRDLYHQAGFTTVDATDITAQSWKRFYEHGVRWRREMFTLNHQNLRTYSAVTLINKLADMGIKKYLLVAARKG
jgi:SAM-dependent methyltransferase